MVSSFYKYREVSDIEFYEYDIGYSHLEVVIFSLFYFF